MREWVVIVAALAACKKSTVEDRIKTAEAAQYDAREPAFCALAADVENEKARPVLVKELEKDTEENWMPDKGNDYTAKKTKCIVNAIAKSKSPPPSAPVAYTKLHYKLQLPQLKPLYDAIPADQKKTATLDAFAELGSDWKRWHNSTLTAAPMMIAELDKLAAADDPRFFRGVVGANYLYDKESVSPVVKERYAKLGQDPRVGQAFKDILVAAVENKDSDAWMGYSSFLEHAMVDLAASNVTFDKDNELRALLRACSHPRAREFCEPQLPKLNAATKTGLRATVDKLGPDDFWADTARELVMSLGSGKPEDIPKLIDALVMADQNAQRTQPANDDELKDMLKGKDRSPITKPNPELRTFATTATALASIGEAARPVLTEMWKKDPMFIKQRVAARALANIDPAGFAKQASAVIDDYNKDLRTLKMPTMSYGNGPIAAAALHALAEAPGADVDTVYFRALSSVDAAFSGFAVQVIKKRLERDKAIDALFAFMAAKDKYAKYEIDVYTSLVTEYGAEATAAVVKNLDAMLTAAGGVPDKVFWAHKVVAMKSLQKVGTRAAHEIVQKYINDPGGYDDTREALDADGNPTGKITRTPVAFKDLASQTLLALH